MNLNLQKSDLYLRRQSRNLDSTFSELQSCCFYCLSEFAAEESVLSVSNINFHVNCFKCSQCFIQLHNEVFYDVDGRFYCEYDYKQNYCPMCQKCKEHITKKVIKTVRGNFHPQCLTCDECGERITDLLFFNNMKNVCEKCNVSRKVVLCAKCKHPVLPEEKLLFRNDVWHVFHFNCNRCDSRLNNPAFEWKNKLYCQLCYDRYIVSTCAACHTIIDLRNERKMVVDGKSYHVNHVACFQCGHKINNEHLVWKDHIYCKTCFLKISDRKCHLCSNGRTFTFLNKNYCHHCFRCVHCHKAFKPKREILEIDGQPICAKCNKRLPSELQKRLKKQDATSPRSA